MIIISQKGIFDEVSDFVNNKIKHIIKKYIQLKSCKLIHDFFGCFCFILEILVKVF